MIDAIELVLDAVSLLLNGNYAIVTLVVEWIYDLVISLYLAFQVVQASAIQVFQLLFSIGAEIFDFVVRFGEVVLWCIAQLIILVQRVFSIVDEGFYKIFEGVSWILSSVAHLISVIWEFIISIILLPHVALTHIDSNLSWCYTELFSLLKRAALSIVDTVADVTYHILLTPYYAGIYCLSFINTSGYVTKRVYEHLYAICVDGLQCAQDLSRNAISKMYTTFHSVFNVYSSSTHYCMVNLSTLANNYSPAYWIIQVSNQVYFYDTQLLFSDTITLTELLSSICLSPLRLVVVAFRTIYLYIKYGFEAIQGDWSHSSHQLYAPLPNIGHCLYCVLEELVWLTWLTVKTNLAGIIIACALTAAVYLSVRRQCLRTYTQYDNMEPRALFDPGAGGDMAGDDEVAAGDEAVAAVVELSESETDDDEPILIELPHTAPQRPHRSRSSTPDLTVPGSETRYIRRLRSKLDDELNNRLCTICQEHSRDILLLPCKHVCVCTYCTREILQRRPATCPLCRTKINQAMNVFL